MLPDQALVSRQEFERFCDVNMYSRVYVLGGYEIDVDPKDESLTPHFVRDGYWESWISLAIARYVAPGMLCVDVGANVGYFTLLMVDRGARVVMAIEPAPDTAERLTRTIKRNALGGRVDVRGVAVGEGVYRATMKRYGRLVGSDSLLVIPGYEVTKEFEVDVAPLDVLVSRWPRVDFVKVDVEGYEARVWAGMEFVRKQNPDLVVCMEVSMREGLDALGFLERVAQEKRLGVVEEDGSITTTTPAAFVEHPMMLKHGFGTAWLS